MLIICHCPHCKAEHELSPKLLGDEILCQKCTQRFIVKETPPTEKKVIPLQSSFSDRTRTQREEMNSAVVETQKQLREGKISLILPPPPIEHWSSVKDKDGPKPRFAEFQHDSRAVRRFLERDDVSDYSWLLVIGLTFSMLLVLGFLGLLTYLCFK